MKNTPKTPNSPNNKGNGKWVRYKHPSRPEVFEAFSLWIAYPRSVRRPKTQGEFARINEVSPDTLSDYKKKPAFWRKVEENREKIRAEVADSLEIAQVMRELEDKDYI